MKEITDLINKSYVTDSCWSFCRDAFKLFDIELPALPREGLVRLPKDKIIIPAIVLFQCGDDWHCGVMWPDGLHFIHANDEDGKFIIRHERITRHPWSILVEGFYTYE